MFVDVAYLGYLHELRIRVDDDQWTKVNLLMYAVDYSAKSGNACTLKGKSPKQAVDKIK